MYRYFCSGRDRTSAMDRRPGRNRPEDLDGRGPQRAHRRAQGRILQSCVGALCKNGSLGPSVGRQLSALFDGGCRVNLTHRVYKQSTGAAPPVIYVIFVGSEELPSSSLSLFWVARSSSRILVTSNS